MFANHIDNKMMHVHLLCFSMYLLGGLALNVAINFFYIEGSEADPSKMIKAEKTALVVMIFCVFMEFAASMTLSFIFYKIGQADVEVRARDTGRFTEKSEYEIQSRITLGRVTMPVMSEAARDKLLDTVLDESEQYDDFEYEVNSPCIFPADDDRSIAMSKILTSFCKSRVMTTREIRNNYIDLGNV